MLYHVSCAWAAGHKVGLEMTLAKPRAAITIARFKDDAGVLTPGIWCRSHSLEGRSIYEPWEYDGDAGETVLQAYAGAYKAVRGGFALLRKAQRLDLADDEETTPALRACGSCKVDVSPLWHGSLCHLCWFAAGRPNKRKADEMATHLDTKPLVNGLSAVLA